MAKLLVIADDLTGAADCAAPSAAQGISAAVLLYSPGEIDSHPRLPDTEILSIDANTRWLSPEQAAQTTAEVVRLSQMSGALGSQSLLFKKLDSTLRGHVATELAAVLCTRRSMWADQGKLSIIMAPALPAQGRSTVGGRQMIRGKSLEEVDLLINGVRAPQSEISTLLAGAGLSCGLIDAVKVRSGLSPLRQAMMSLAWEADVILCDAETDDDLRAIAEASIALGQHTIWAGSAGLAWHIPHAAGMMKSSGDQPRLSFAAGPALFVVGSRTSVSHQQARMLASVPEVVAMPLAPASLLISHAPIAQIIAALQSGRDVLIVLDRNEQLSDLETERISRELAKMIAPCATLLGALVLTGGETARAILDELGICRLRLLGEVEPGLPFAVAEAWTRPLMILTKAGGFGSAETLVHCRDFLQTLDRTVAQPPTPSLLLSGEAVMPKPIVAITMGDAAGIGPEIVMKSLGRPEVRQLCCPIVIGDAERLRAAGRIIGTGLKVRSIRESNLDPASFDLEFVNCIDLKLIPPNLAWGEISRQAGEAAYRYLEVAARLAMDSKVAAICTAPLNKAALQAAGHKFPGHTELLAHLTGTPEVSMMLTTPKMRVLHVTTHMGLIDAIARIEPGLVERTIARGHDALEKTGVLNPHIGVCGINPHAGENGLFGHGEEEEKIVPAVVSCRRLGWNVEGPLPADTLFFRAQRGDFDLVVAMYHDQGHGPVKVLGLESGVNITIGLPVVRTSVDHGTAFDIAGTGRADERSLVAAIRQAVQLAPKWEPGKAGFR